jgi:hypothetical protein
VIAHGAGCRCWVNQAKSRFPGLFVLPQVPLCRVDQAKTISLIGDEIAAFFNSFDERWVDYRHVERRRVVSGNDAIWEGTGQGTWKMTGKPVEFPMIMSLVFNDAGEIIASQVYLDPGRVRAQAQ